jgi:hypothetical protein
VASVDLVFEGAGLANPADLVFGDVGSPPDREVYVDGVFPFTVRAKVGPRIETVIDAAFTLTCNCEIEYDINVDRPLVAQVHARHQPADKLQPGVDIRHHDAQALPAGFEAQHQTADKVHSGPVMRFVSADPLHSDPTTARHQNAQRVPNWLVEMRHQNGLRDRRTSTHSRFQDADPVRGSWHTRYQDRYRDRRPSHRGRWQEADAFFVEHREFSRGGAPFIFGRDSRWQEAWVPRPGESVIIPPEPPIDEPCYDPELPANLVFKELAAVNGNLLFVCEFGGGPPANVVVPIKRVYVVINTVSLRRVVGDIQIPALSMSLSIDVDSWTWGFNATLPGSELSNVMPGSGPIELEANINGTLYRVLAERISRDRSFGQSTIRVSGRGKSAALASPYSLLRTFTNDTARTANQLMEDVLTLSGVPIGWAIDWDIEDWLVPAGAFSMNGAYIDGLNAIAGAAGAYLQPHPVNNEMRVLHRYPTAPWEWGTVTPDFDLPAAVTVQEGIEWDEKPFYNAVYVSGTSQGILARVLRDGSAGDLYAQMVTDPLNTAVEAARQRGRAILSNTGRQAKVSLRLPVLAETGVITPGKYVRYNDGTDEHIGIVRSTSVDAGFPEVWQSLIVETHV